MSAEVRNGFQKRGERTHHSSKSANRISPKRPGSSLGIAAFKAGPDNDRPRSAARVEASKYLELTAVYPSVHCLVGVSGSPS
jgi:hypothetical protein